MKVPAWQRINEEKLTQFRTESAEELTSILTWWATFMQDNTDGGFYGGADNRNNPQWQERKGLVLNCRILWTFSAAYNQLEKPAHLTLATRAFDYLSRYFTDPVYGGFYWSVDHLGKLPDSKKQIYGQAFGIYGLSEYYRASRQETALEMAKSLFHAIEKYSLDTRYGGYLEAFNDNWTLADDLRLSNKDENEIKSMNTQLHVLEAYVNLYRVWADEKLKNAIKKLLNVFHEKIIDKRSYHQHLFFSEDWTVRSTLVSFGHDIEAAWLLFESAVITGDSLLYDIFRNNAVKMADAAAEGIDNDGGMWHEYDLPGKHSIREKHWWPQAEAMVGFLNAWQITGKNEYLDIFFRSWEFIKKHLRDQQNGEWFWGVNADYSVIQGEGKAGFWKCPYHNARAFMEILRRI